MKILLAVDGSEHSVRAVRHVIGAVDGCAKHEIMLLNVQEPIDAPEILGHMKVSEIEAMQENRGGDALGPARQVLDAAGVAYTPYVLIGPLAETIHQFAIDRQCDKIVMGTRGLGALGSMLLGSVSSDVLKLTALPVTLVK